MDASVKIVKTPAPVVDPAAPIDWHGFVRQLLSVALAAFDRHIGSRSLVRLLCIVLAYGVQLGLVFYLAYELRWDFEVPDSYALQCVTLILPIVFCKLLMLYSFGQFRTIQSYFGLADFGSVLLAMASICGVMLGLWLWADPSAAPPRGVILMDFVMSVAIVAAARLALRIARTSSLTSAGVAGGERRIAILGSKDAGEALAKDLLQRRGSGLRPVCFIDDDADRIGRSIHGLPVYGPVVAIARFVPKLRINELVIADTGIAPKRIKEIVELGRQHGATTQIVPSFTQLASGEMKVERSRPVAIEDLLGRSPVNLDSESMAGVLHDRVVLVTGAGGSIGAELCRQVLRHGPKILVMADQAEIALFEIEQELMAAGHGTRLRPMILDVADEAAVRAMLECHRPEVVFHAAAHKHVPLMERQPAEALKNNTLATALLTRLASELGVAWFVFISTDKAINPTSVMGCSKRLAEMAMQAQQAAAGNRTRFIAVRFGNVLGSSGSVIPIFRRQIAQGGPVTVTHADMTRYFMTIPEAVGLVLQTVTLGTGGEIFILDMSEPVKIMDMARQMIELSGYRPGVDIEIKVTGLRPGEKLFEELRHTEEAHEMTSHPRIFRLRAAAANTSAVWLAQLDEVARTADSPAIKRALKQIVPEYQPYFE